MSVKFLFDAPFDIPTWNAWKAWRAASCEEFNGGHNWHLEIDCGSVDLSCKHCPADSEDFAEGSHDFLTGSFPVALAWHGGGYDRYTGEPADAWLEVTPRVASASR